MATHETTAPDVDAIRENFPILDRQIGGDGREPRRRGVRRRRRRRGHHRRGAVLEIGETRHAQLLQIQ
jgi:hypothetical protein